MGLRRRLAFVVHHLIAHVLFYRVPRLFSGIFCRWPQKFVRWLTRGPATAPAKDEREVTVITAAADPRRLRQRFGLPRPDQPPFRYRSPLYNGHVETILAAMRISPSIHYERELVESHAGQHVNMDYIYPRIPSSSSSAAAAAVSAASHRAPHAKGLIFVVPGLLNASTTNYVQHFSQTCTAAGFAVCVLNYRGMGTTPLEVPRLFSATFTEDIRHCLHHYLRPEQVQERLGTERTVPLIAVGFSLGGVTLIKYLGEQGLAAEAKERTSGLPPGSVAPDTPVAALLTVTSPYDLIQADKRTATAAYRYLYERPFAVGLRKYARHNREMLARLPNVDAAWLFEGSHPAINDIASVRDFDAFINAGHNGFAGPQEYYAAAQPFVWLPRCRTPVCCIGDRNDVVAGGSVPDAAWRTLVERNPHVAYVCFPVGGHLGFLGTPVAEWRGDANEAERLVIHVCASFCATE